MTLRALALAWVAWGCSCSAGPFDGCTVDEDCTDVAFPQCDQVTEHCVNPCGECPEGELCDLETETCE